MTILPSVGTYRAVLGLLASFFFLPEATAAPVRYDLDEEAELTGDGWEFYTSSTGTSSFANGELTIDTPGFGEWLLFAESSAPWFTATRTSGWYVEARVRVESAVGCGSDGGVGIWMNPGDLLVKLHLETDQAGISYPEVLSIPMDTSDGFHVYRVQNLGGQRVELIIDGEIVLDEMLARGGGGSVALNFGDLGGCTTSHSTWDYLEYDVVAPPIPDGDADGDGVDNGSDTCVLIDDASQADGDNDGIGDACDDCPSDAANDADNDGLCADMDVCPDDAKNDSNANGVCDTEECAAAEAAGNCLAFCNCSPCNGLPAAAPAPAEGTGGTLSRPIIAPVGGCAGFIGQDPVAGFGGTLSTGGSAGLGTGGSSTAGSTSAGTGGSGTGGSNTGAGGSGTGGSGTGGSDTGAGGSGTGGSGGTGATGATGGSTQGTGGSGPDDSPEWQSSDTEGGCACSLERASTPRQAGTWALLVAAFLFAAARRRRH